MSKAQVIVPSASPCADAAPGSIHAHIGRQEASRLAEKADAFGCRRSRALLDEIRFGLAREYLGKTNLPMEEICGLLGYSESGNFSHAFRRWSGQSPRDWRQQAAAL